MVTEQLRRRFRAWMRAQAMNGRPVTLADVAIWYGISLEEAEELATHIRQVVLQPAPTRAARRIEWRA